MSLATNVEETEIPKLGKHSHINSDGNLSTRHTNSMSGLYSNAGRAVPILRNLGCVASHNCRSLSLFTGTLLLKQPSPGIGFCLTRQPSASPIVCFIKQSRFQRTRRVSIQILPLIL